MLNKLSGPALERTNEIVAAVKAGERPAFQEWDSLVIPKRSVLQVAQSMFADRSRVGRQILLAPLSPIELQQAVERAATELDCFFWSPFTFLEPLLSGRADVPPCPYAEKADRLNHRTEMSNKWRARLVKGVHQDTALVYERGWCATCARSFSSITPAFMEACNEVCPELQNEFPFEVFHRSAVSSELAASIAHSARSSKTSCEWERELTDNRCVRALASIEQYLQVLCHMESKVLKPAEKSAFRKKSP